jgi:hypothetical protein
VDEKPLSEERSLVEIYAGAITGLSKKIEELIQLAHRYSLRFTTTLVISIFVFLSFVQIGNFRIDDAKDIQIPIIISYVLASYLILAAVYCVMSAVGYYKVRSELTLFLEPFQSVLREITTILDHGQLGAHSKLALRFRIIEGEVSLRRSENIIGKSILGPVGAAGIVILIGIAVQAGHLIEQKFEQRVQSEVKKHMDEIRDQGSRRE